MSSKVLVYGDVVGPEGPVDPGFGHPKPPSGDVVWPPISLPPLPPGISLPPGTWPPQKPPVDPGYGRPTLPEWPIVIPQPPEKPQPGLPPTVGGGPVLPEGPAVIWPPIPPGHGIAGKCLILIWVVGIGYRWLVYEGKDIWPPPPPEAGPK